MSGAAKIRLGNMFDGPSDLIVLPCSTEGNVTDFVAKTLENYNIPFPRINYRLGDIDIRPFEGGENIAQFVAFAASVQNMSSNLDAIRSIGAQIGNFTQQEKSVRAISTPLLGAGSGGLRSEDVVYALTEGFKSSAYPDAILTISILHNNVFQRISSNATRLQESREVPRSPRKAPRLFISYTASSPEHRNWVVQLATFLRQNGIEARLDQWHLRKGMDLPQWMTNELQLAERVLVISDAQYAAKADGRLGGVGWETMIIQGDATSVTSSNNKYLVIVRESDFASGIPMYLRTKYCIHWPIGANDHHLKQELLKELYDVTSEPPIGEPPIWL